MILKGSQRQGPRALAAHLLNQQENDHVSMPELRGFMSDDLFGAMAETEAVAKGTKCRQSVFSLSLNPPKGADVSVDAFIAAADRAEAALGLTGQPRAIVIHEKQGRKHAHVVWSRIDAEQMKAVNLPFFKRKLAALSKDLYLENNWELPEGHKAHGWKNPLNYTLAEWQQAKRQDMDPREIKQIFQSAWQRSDNLQSFKNALEEQGYYLARGDRRGFVALDVNGEVYAVARALGIKTKQVTQKLGSPDKLPPLADARDQLDIKIIQQMRGYLAQDRAAKAKEREPLAEAARRMTQLHRSERFILQKKQTERTQAENRIRASRLRHGFKGILDAINGRAAATRRQNEQEALQDLRRDRAQREQLFAAQLKERADMQKQIDALKMKHQHERTILVRRVAWQLARTRDNRHRHIRRYDSLEL